MSWKVVKDLGILPVNYPDPIPVTTTTMTPALPPVAEVKIICAATPTQTESESCKGKNSTYL